MVAPLRLAQITSYKQITLAPTFSEADHVGASELPHHIKDRALPAGRSHDSVKSTTGRMGLRPTAAHLAAHPCATQCEPSKDLAGSFPATVACSFTN